jgi:prevent-host-death family protein
LDEILEDAQRQPIMITRQGQDMAVVVSIADYQRLRASNIGSFLQLRNELANEAARAGLTERRLAELLTDDER